ncbi:hypothetical protein DXG01_017063 [Tephrocybe rancida]|nr:hypothetical protein DXG01_017063 [Tephrocybe rancida]
MGGLEEDLLKYSEVKPHTGPVTSFRYRKSNQTPGLDFYTLVTKGNLMLFHRADFQRVLLRRLPKTCQAHCSKRLQSYSQCLSGPIEVIFEDGSRTTCDVLIGADGLKSAVRRSFLQEKAAWARSEGRNVEAVNIDASIDPVWTGQNAYRALIPTERLKRCSPDHKILSRPTQCKHADLRSTKVPGQEWRKTPPFLNERHQLIAPLLQYIIAYPIARGKFVNFVAFTANHEREYSPFQGKWVSKSNRAEFAGLFAEWEPEVQELISCVDDPIRWAVHTIKPLDSFISGGVALIGDAAHAMTPHQGSGAGQALEDAYILGTVLGHPSTTRTTLDRALHIFDHIRRPHALRVAEKSRRNGQIFTLHDLDLEGLPDDALLVELNTLSEEFTKSWEWAWSTSIEGSKEEALRMLES